MPATKTITEAQQQQKATAMGKQQSEERKKTADAQRTNK